MRNCIIMALVIMVPGCTDGTKAKIAAYGGSAKITCYSGERMIFQGESTGKVQSEANSDGYYFVDKKDNKLKEVSGNCVIEYQEYSSSEEKENWNLNENRKKR